MSVHGCAYDDREVYRWDPAKPDANRDKHAVEFGDAVGVLEDPRALTANDPHPDEPRFVTLGLDLLLRVLVVCWTQRGEEQRLISARKATPTERRQYDKKR